MARIGHNGAEHGENAMVNGSVVCQKPLRVTRSYLPPLGEYIELLRGIWDNRVLTNQGGNVCRLQRELDTCLGVRGALVVANGTLALQIALTAVGARGGEVVTTPFSYVATAHSILWEHCTPIFVDIEPEHFTIDPGKIEAAITPHTRAILPVHVFGYSCDTDAIRTIAADHKLPVIYDGAHAFGARYKGKSLLSYGDISTCSFHATKLFHTVEGGAVITRDPELAAKMDLMRRFGHNGDEHFCVGINAKMSELHAAMGLAILPHVREIICRRQRICEQYDSLLAGVVEHPSDQPDLEPNYGYYPVLFRDEAQLKKVFAALAAQEIYPRRYFFPALNLIPHVTDKSSCPVAQDIASRIACLPLSDGMTSEDVERVCLTLHLALKSS